MSAENNKNEGKENAVESRAVAAAGEVAYHWVIANDDLAWSENATQVLQRDAAQMATGKRFSSMLDPDNLTSRYDAVMNSADEPQPQGVRFCIEYQLRPTLDAPAIWVEDTGCWYPDEQGKPQDVFGIIRRVDKRHEHDQTQSYLNRNDALTGMMNRGRMMEALDEAMGSSQRANTPCAFAIASIRNLDVVNEAYGFDIADEVVAAVAQRLRKVLRSGDGIARYSDSKFGFILNQCSPAELARALDRFLLVVRDSVIETKRGPVWAMLSIGAVSIPDHAALPVEAISRAAEALNSALRMTSDGFLIHMVSEERETARMINARCATEIVECLKSGVFHLAYQPVIDAKSGEVVLHEALLRLKDSAGEFVAAGYLIPVAERLGLVRLIDRAVLQLALETLHRYPKARLSINISATTANDKRWSAQLIEMIAAAQPINERLTVEITETTALADLSVALEFFANMRAAGCCVAIDDFGVGFTSLRNLRDLPVDIIKLDGSYCRDLHTSEENRYFAKSLIDMAHRFGIKSVAEWVETETDAAALREIGVDYLQGHWLGEPTVVPPWSDAHDVAFSFDLCASTAAKSLGKVDVTHMAELTVPVEQAFELSGLVENILPESPIEEVDADWPALEVQSAAVEFIHLAPEEAILPEAETDDLVNDATDTSLSKLREALDLLNLHFRHDKPAPEPERLAG